MDRIGIVGATGLVGREILRLLEKRKFPLKTLRFFASEASLGKTLPYRGEDYPVEFLTDEDLENLDLVFFCAGRTVARRFLPHPTCKAIDLSSVFRLIPSVPLIIPEINGDKIDTRKTIISSPNCTTTLLSLALYKLHRKYKVKRIVCSTYQAASGGGKKQMESLIQDCRSFSQINPKKDPSSLAFNLFLHESRLNPNGYTDEELKMQEETPKILDDLSIQISATCVRVPVLRAHSVAANVSFEEKIDLEDMEEILKNTPGLVYIKDRTEGHLPTPFDATGKEEVFCGRLRRDLSQENGIDLWIVGDQILKGAALNAVQIAESLRSCLSLA